MVEGLTEGAMVEGEMVGAMEGGGGSSGRVSGGGSSGRRDGRSYGRVSGCWLYGAEVGKSNDHTEKKGECAERCVHGSDRLSNKK